MLDKLAQIYQMDEQQIQDLIQKASQMSAPPPPEVIQQLMAKQQTQQQPPQNVQNTQAAAPNLSDILGG